MMFTVASGQRIGNGLCTYGCNSKGNWEAITMSFTDAGDTFQVAVWQAIAKVKALSKS